MSYERSNLLIILVGLFLAMVIYYMYCMPAISLLNSDFLVVSIPVAALMTTAAISKVK